MEETTTVTRKYQITLPKRIRRQLGIKIGDKLPIFSKKNKIIIKTTKVVPNPAEYLWNLSKNNSKMDAVKLIKHTRRKVYQ
jgi:AbrB family looped-hinge helix DNA binding protein